MAGIAQGREAVTTSGLSPRPGDSRATSPPPDPTPASGPRAACSGGPPRVQEAARRQSWQESSGLHSSGVSSPAPWRTRRVPPAGREATSTMYRP